MSERTSLSHPSPNGSRPRPPAAVPSAPERRHVPFDPELRDVLDEFGPQPPLTAADIPGLRSATDAGKVTDEALRAAGAVRIEEHVASGRRDRSEVRLLVCRPARGAAPHPVIYHVHGGGMIAGTRRHLLSDALTWLRELSAVIVSVEYRLAPEHPYPAALEDCRTGLEWTVDRAPEWHADPRRTVVVGASAGGGLAAGLALLARDRGGPRTAGQMLLSPMLDDRNDSPSSRQLAGLGMWDRASNAVAWHALLGAEAGGPDVSCYAAPARAGDLSGLPPAYLDTGSAETFRDETVAYAGALWRDGGRCELHVWPGGFHGSDQLVPQAELSRRAKAARLRWLRALLT
ncbi:alpha/beta hydrolase [Streptomyces sp. NPDC059786]|uniref:alpha/beta hydrolase n=1 Tax=Streptomyces sp. NPDC059786 TaxID=3346946 RepID=UPI0036564201